VGYDVSSASYFADRDSDLERDDYIAAEWRRFVDLQQALTNQLVLPAELARQLAAEEPISVVAAEAAAIARIDQVSAGIRNPGEPLDPELQRIVDLNKLDYPTSSTGRSHRVTGNSLQSYHRSPRRDRDTGHGLDT
jgi:hypothetical protein